MLKRFLKTIAVASIITITLYGGRGKLSAMWDEENIEDKYEQLRIHRDEHTSKIRTSIPGKGLQKTESEVCGQLFNGKKRPDLKEDPLRLQKITQILNSCSNCTIMHSEKLLINNQLKINKKEEEIQDKKEQVITQNSNKDNATTSIFPIEEGESLFSTVKSLRQTKLQHEGIIKNLNEEAEESTEIIKKMMKIIGIKTDDFSDCTGNIFAKKCLDRLNHEMGSL